jgi:mono/diheme cytochrome c family protein
MRHPLRSLRVRRAAAIAALVVLVVRFGHAQEPLAPTSRQNGVQSFANGEQLYRAACITCHGPDGKGSPRTVVGFDIDLPDFTDCAFATAEADVDWHAVVKHGGRTRGLSRAMPAFGDALSDQQIQDALGYIRHFCPDERWPRGDLNFPRALFTEKAFPENELVYTFSHARGSEATLGNEIVYERRFGARDQIEALVPFASTKQQDSWNFGVGDIAFGYRRTLIANRRTGTIAAAGGEVAFPTGDSARGLGNGYYVFEPFAMLGQALPRNGFLQMHGGLEIPSNDATASTEAYLRSAVGMTVMSEGGYGRSWSPQVEILFARPFGEEATWDIVPQLQVSLSKLQHVMIAGGVRIPMNARHQRRPAIVTYLLWDWFDGSFTRFWK